MNRLSKIFSLIDKCETFADIGCDHGKLCKMVADEKKAEKIIAADISAASLSKAKELLRGYENIGFYVSDGFSQIPIGIDSDQLVHTPPLGLKAAGAAGPGLVLGYDTGHCAVISGMGGREILKIISAKTVKTLILQPQNQIGAVRRWLYETGYQIIADEIVKDAGKFYFVLKAVFKGGKNKEACGCDDKNGKVVSLTAVQEMYGVFYKTKSTLLKELLEKDERKYLSFKTTKENEDKLKIIREAMLCQR